MIERTVWNVNLTINYSSRIMSSRRTEFGFKYFGPTDLYIPVISAPGEETVSTNNFERAIG